MMGEWLVGGAEEKLDGVGTVSLRNPLDTREQRPSSGKLKFKVAKNRASLPFSISLTCEKYVSVVWEYEPAK
jgi:hypothetical protein